MILRKISELSPHPINVEIYGDNAHMNELQRIEFEDLKNSIMSKGLVDPIIIDQDDNIISGHRRYYAHKELGLEEIKTRELKFVSNFQRIDYLLTKNEYRSKTNAQKIREGLFREANIAEKARKKMLHLEDEFSDSDTVAVVTREAVGKTLGMSGSTYDTGKKVVKEIDRLRDEGEIEKADALEDKVNVTISGAANELKALKGKPFVETDPDFWFIEDLEAMIKYMEMKASKMAAKSKSTTPAALSWFFNTIQNDAKLYRSWFKGEMRDCPICSGTMFLKNGSSCGNCISGKVGVYTLPEDNI